MIYKFIGAALIIISCGCFGFAFAAGFKKEERCLKQLIAALDYMSCELSFKHTALPELCKKAGEITSGAVKKVFDELCCEFSYNLTCDVLLCMKNALQRVRDVPPLTFDAFIQMGYSLGRFNIDGQIKSLEAAKAECSRYLKSIMENQPNRIRSYQTLGLCAGAAIVIIFI